MSVAGDRLPLSALLAKILVAYVVEFDNEFEHQVPHRTTRYGSTPGIANAPWLVSMAMWIRFMRYIPVEGITFSELKSNLAISSKGLKTWLTRLGKWWGYLEIDAPEAAGAWEHMSLSTNIRPTTGGRVAIECWKTLLPTMENRWRKRFGNRVFDALESSLKQLTAQLHPAIPTHFPILEYEDRKSRAARLQLSARECSLQEHVAKVLLAFESDFNIKSSATLAVCANVLRITPDSGISLRHLHNASGLSMDGVNDALRQLAREGLGAVRTAVARKPKVLTLNSKGCVARDNYRPLADSIENNWARLFGEDTVSHLRHALEAIVKGNDYASSALLRGLKPYPDGWRAQLAVITDLPHFPMHSHRGGFPDGS